MFYEDLSRQTESSDTHVAVFRHSFYLSFESFKFT